ncbi:solute carrier family 49 member 4 homolog isoform X2 [Babylonia areolata]|uniref:solute carrier family 49 member 4 homolog isoform X2 n=1 Tax=Babylonia areolata TaxID=304850 RepID=UPI003FD5B3FC
MRSNSPFPVINSPYARSRSFSHHYPGPSSPQPVSPFADTAFLFPGCTTPSPFPRRVSRGAPEGGLDSVIERTHDGSEGGEREPLLKPEGVEAVTVLYARRWYLLVLFSFVALLQTMSWAAWGPISESAEAVLGWEDSDITMCVFVGNLSFCVCCIPFSWLMDHKGLRVSAIVTSFFVMAGAGLRCLVRFVPSSYYTWCIYGGQLLNGVAGPVAQGGGALFSSLWFPTNQRATSTAISTFIGYAGNALAFIVGPLLIPSPSADDPNSNNDTLPNGNDTDGVHVQKIIMDSGNSSGSTDNNVILSAILNYMDYQAIAAAGVFALVVLYFPDRPPRPPSLSAASDREDFGPGLAKLLKNRQFWLISAAFCLSLGVFEVWDVVLDVNLSTIGISQEEAGWMGFYCVMAGCLTGLLICRLADIFFRQIRLFLILSYVVSAIFVLWFILIYINVLPFDMVSIYAAIILSGVFLDGCSPLVYELICEAAYPVGEGVSSCFLQMLFVLVGMAFAAVQNIPDIGTEWMNWCLFGTLCAAIPLLFLVTDTYSRAQLDAVQEQVSVVHAPDNPSTQRDHAEKGSSLTKSLPLPTPNHHLTSLTLSQHRGYGTCNTSPSPSLLHHSGEAHHRAEHRPTSQPNNSAGRSLGVPIETDSHGCSSGKSLGIPIGADRHRCLSQPAQNPRNSSRAAWGQESQDHPSVSASRAASSVSVQCKAFYYDAEDNNDREHLLGRDASRVDEGRREDLDVDRSGWGMLERDRSFRGEGRASDTSSSCSVHGSPESRSLLMSGQHSVDLSFLRVNGYGP